MWGPKKSVPCSPKCKKFQNKPIFSFSIFGAPGICRPPALQGLWGSSLFLVMRQCCTLPSSKQLKPPLLFIVHRTVWTPNAESPSLSGNQNWKKPNCADMPKTIPVSFLILYRHTSSCLVSLKVTSRLWSGSVRKVNHVFHVILISYWSVEFLPITAAIFWSCSDKHEHVHKLPWSHNLPGKVIIITLILS